MTANRVLLVAALLSLQGCFIGSLMGQAKKGSRARITNIKANADNWAKLDATAKELGWGSKRSNAIAEFDLIVMVTTPKGELQMDDDPDAHTISYVCDKGPLADENKCFDAMNELLGRAFNIKLQK